MTSIRDVLASGRKALDNSSSSPRIDLEILLCQVLNTNQAFLYTHPEKNLSSNEEVKFKSMVEARAKGMPIAYLTGEKEFWSLPLRVSEATLIPRPETELLVEKALSILDESSEIRVLELGTGSGAIAIALAHTRPNWHITAVERSAQALNVAIKNAERLGIKNIKFIFSDWFSKVDEVVFDAVISNPPYIAEGDPHLFSGDLRFEPNDALISEGNGLQSLQYIIKRSYNYLTPNGVILLEHGFDQRVAVEELLQQNGYLEIKCWQDLQNQDRVSFGTKRKNP
ncbi:MAG: peptide chain release factor N(5)-glutamine methyltransferase [Legionellaceae bacterium]|nr:peptide chain release factor N(5)-glutamine methyltransferase [Legionellaceae bacterium]